MVSLPEASICDSSVDPFWIPHFFSTKALNSHEQDLQVSNSAQYGSISEILPLRRVFVAATDLDGRDTILKELRTFPKLVVVGRKDDAEFFILFALTDQATGA